MFSLALFLLSLNASAASFTYSDPNCTAGFLMSSTGAITCAAGPMPPVPPVEPPISCNGYTNTLTMHVTIPPNGGGTGARVYNTDAKSAGGAGANFTSQDALVVVFTAPPTDTQFLLGFTHAGGASGASTQRTFAISASPCDFIGLWSDQANVMSLRMSTGTPSSGRLDLTPGTRYYLNVRNFAYNAWTCTSICNSFISPSNPN